MVNAYHITLSSRAYSILQRGILSCKDIPEVTRGLGPKLNKENYYDLLYDKPPVFITFCVKEAIEQMGYYGSVDQWVVAVIDATNLNVKEGLFPWESIADYIPAECIKRFEPLSNFLK
jgi:hypothetical protein